MERQGEEVMEDGMEGERSGMSSCWGCGLGLGCFDGRFWVALDVVLGMDFGAAGFFEGFLVDITESQALMKMPKNWLDWFSSGPVFTPDKPLCLFPSWGMKDYVVSHGLFILSITLAELGNSKYYPQSMWEKWKCEQLLMN
jgi:hypothetical protein